MALNTFDTLFTLNVPHILERIFLFLDYTSFKKCMDVCVAWNELLKSKSFKTKARSCFRKEISGDERKLWFVSNGGSMHEVKELVSSGMLNVDCAGGNWGLTPLCAASGNGNSSVVKVLLEGGAEVDKPGLAGETPLFWAAFYGNTDVGELLLDTGAEPNKTNKEGKTPLHVAANKGHQEMVRLLLERGAEYDRVDEEGWTPLHLATFNDHLDILQILLHRGADPNRTDVKGRKQTALH